MSATTAALFCLLGFSGVTLWLLLGAVKKSAELGERENQAKAQRDQQKQQTELANELRKIAEDKPNSRADSLERMSAKNHPEK